MRLISEPVNPFAAPAVFNALATLNWLIVCAAGVKSMPPLAPVPVKVRYACVGSYDSAACRNAELPVVVTPANVPLIEDPVTMVCRPSALPETEADTVAPVIAAKPVAVTESLAAPFTRIT